MSKQTILGAGGAIGKVIAKTLPAYTDTIQLVARNPKKVNESDILFKADLTDKDQVDAAIAGSDVVYVTAGLEYKLKVWQQQWPVIIDAVIEACIRHNAKLVFYDNIYMLSADSIPHITEESPMNPPSKKGLVRKYIDTRILESVEKGKLQAIIARSPDFIGPEIEKSMLMNLVYNNLVKGKKAQWFCNANLVHSEGFTPELGKATAILGNTADAYNQIWNLPTDKPITAKEWIALFAQEMHAKAGVQVLPGWMIKAIGIFVPVIGEFYEMRYQYYREYYFDSSKYEKRFNYTPISNENAVKETLRLIKNDASA